MLTKRFAERAASTAVNNHPRYAFGEIDRGSPAVEHADPVVVFQ